MTQGNLQAARIFSAAGVRSCTDITGFGLLGHLVEMLNASQIAAQLNIFAIPLLPGTEALIGEGFLSSLDPANRAFGAQLDCTDLDSPSLAPLFDPQTSGGLLAAVPAHLVDDCLRQLRTQGYERAAVIGEVQPGDAGRVRLAFEPTSVPAD